MTSAQRGASTSEVELGHVSADGLLLLVDGREVYLPFDEFPWFRGASIGALAKIERPSAEHLRWPELDVDLTIESIEHPERYPLVSNRSSSR